MRADLKRLRRDSETGRVSRSDIPAARPPRSKRLPWWVPIGGGVIVAAAALGWWISHRRTTANMAVKGQKTIAILPFQNLSGDSSIDYLRLGLPDEIATTLSYVPALAIRPFASSRKF